MALISNNFSGYKVPIADIPANIRIIFLPPNTTSYLQPCDQGITATLKAYCRQLYCRGLLTWLEAHPTPESRISTSSTGRQNSLQYNPDILTAIQTVLQAWSEVSAETICRCWNKAHLRLEGPVEPFRLANGNPHYELGQVLSLSESNCVQFPLFPFLTNKISEIL